MIRLKRSQVLLLIGALNWCATSGVKAEPLPQVQPIVQPGDRTTGQSESTLILAENGKALLPIVIAADASESIKATAQYLAERLEKLSGTKFEIETGDGSAGIALGTIAQFPVASLQKSLEVRSVISGVDIKNGVEAYAIRTESKRVLLLGGDDLGVSHAAARFLELLGYRQFYPAPEWEIAPQQSPLKFNRNETDRPEILARHIWYAFGVPVDPYTFETSTVKPEERSIRSKTDLPAWYRQNRLGETFKVYAAHNYATIINSNKAEFEAHPEYYALIDGKRSPRTICLTELAVQRMAAELAVAYFDKNPDRDMYSMEPGDGNAMCECDRCQAMGSFSNRVFNLANIGARAVRQKHSGKMIGVLAYNMHDVPPDIELEPNVHVQVARLFIQSGKTFRQLVEEWSQKTNNLGIYDYFSTFQWGQDRLRPKAQAGPTADLSLLKSDIPFLANQGVLSLWSETSVAWGAHGRGNLVATRLMWNSQANVDAVLSDFYDKAFGPAAPAMKRYFERVDGGNELFSETLLGLAARDVDEAAKLAKDRPDVLARIDHIKQFLYFNYLMSRSMEAKNIEESKPWTFELLKHQFRTRYAYMTHWAAQANYLSDVAKKYNEPSWALPGWKEVVAAKKEGRTIPNPPWLVWESYTHAETDAKFREVLDYFQPKTILPRGEYSDDLVPVEFPNAPAPVESTQVQSGRSVIYLYSVAGEPLEIEIKVGKIGDPLPYVLRDRSSKSIEEGQLPQDDGKHALKIEVPTPGLYTLEYSGHGWWSYSVPPERANAILLPQQTELWAYTMQGLGGRMFFYVPKGTRQIQFFWSGGDHSIFDASGKPLIKVTDTNDYITIDVPPGMDGQPWSFTGRYDTRKFINVPGYVAPSPQALLVPREVAIKDGLKIKGQ